MSVTIREVAREAGVSVATVSRVLNSSGPVSEGTRARIERIAQELRYVPNGAARSLITSRTQTLGVILPDLYGQFFSEVIRGIDGAVRAQQYHLLVSSSHSDRDELHAALESMHGRVDGLLVMSPHVDAGVLQQVLPAHVPAVLLGSARGEVPVQGHVTMDNFGGARLVTEHLVGLGHRRIVHLAGPAENADAQARQAGFRAALDAAGLSESDAVVTGDFTEEGGGEAALRALDRADPPTALVAANDSMAIGAILALRERGVRVPEDVAVTGFDDLPIGRYFTPALTTVHVAIGQLGVRGTALLFRALETQNGPAEAAPVPEIIPAQLVVRASCGAQR